MTAKFGSTSAIRLLVLSAVFGLHAASGLPTLAAGQPLPTVSTPAIYVANVNSIIHPVSAEYMIQTLDLADQAGAALVVFTLRTPGGLVDSTRDIVIAFDGGEDSGRRLRHAARRPRRIRRFHPDDRGRRGAMSPGTHIGAAHPVTGSGEKMDETTAEEGRGRPGRLCAHAGEPSAAERGACGGRHLESRAFTEQEALGVSPPLIDLVATMFPTCCEKLHGRTSRRSMARPLVLRTEGARVVPVT